MRHVAKATNMGARKAWLWRHRLAFGQPARSEQQSIFVDVSAILRHDAQTGIQRVVRAVWSELKGRRAEGLNVMPVYATGKQGYCYAPLDFLERPDRPLGSIPVCARPGDKFLGLDLSAHLLPKYRRQLRAWRSHGASVHIVVYDLLPLQRPDWFSSAASAHYRRWFEILSEEVDQAICISDQVADELRDTLALIETARHLKIGRLHMGFDIAASQPSSGLCDEVRRLLEQLRFRPAVLMVGTVEPRKGYDAAIAAFEHLWRTRGAESPDLIIVGKGGWKTDALQHSLRFHPENSRRLHWLDSVSDEGLCLFYEACRGVLVASRGEGFGLPLVEAAQHRRPVLARDLRVFRDQGLPNVTYFKSDDAEALADDIMALVNVELPTKALQPQSWSDCVDELLQQIGIDQPKPLGVKTSMRQAS